MELAPLDLALLAVVALVAAIGLFRGLSGELASLAGFAAAAAAGYCLYGSMHVGVRALGFNRGDATELVAAGVVDFAIGLVAFGLVRWGVNKFVSFLVPQPTNALLGGLSGLVKGFMLLCLLTGVGFLRPGTYAQSFFATHSQVIHTLASWADSFAADYLQEADYPQEAGYPQEGDGG